MQIEHRLFYGDDISGEFLVDGEVVGTGDKLGKGRFQVFGCPREAKNLKRAVEQCFKVQMSRNSLQYSMVSETLDRFTKEGR